MSELIKISKSKGDFKINGIVIFGSEMEVEKVKENSWKDGRPSLTRDRDVTKRTNSSDWDFEGLRLVLNDLGIEFKDEDIQKEFNSTDAICVTRGRSHAWTAKGLGEFLNYAFDKEIFVSYGHFNN